MVRIIYTKELASRHLAQEAKIRERKIHRLSLWLKDKEHSKGFYHSYR
jgi:hypothetical protein